MILLLRRRSRLLFCKFQNDRISRAKKLYCFCLVPWVSIGFLKPFLSRCGCCYYCFNCYIAFLIVLLDTEFNPFSICVNSTWELRGYTPIASGKLVLGPNAPTSIPLSWSHAYNHSMFNLLWECGGWLPFFQLFFLFNWMLKLLLKLSLVTESSVGRFIYTYIVLIPSGHSILSFPVPSIVTLSVASISVLSINRCSNSKMINDSDGVCSGYLNFYFKYVIVSPQMNEVMSNIAPSGC